MWLPERNCTKSIHRSGDTPLLEIIDVIKKLHICYPNPRGRKEIEPRGNSWL